LDTFRLLERLVRHHPRTVDESRSHTHPPGRWARYDGRAEYGGYACGVGEVRAMEWNTADPGSGRRLSTTGLS
jgi:hypothetical protein